MKFLHSADWHLGRQSHNVSLLEDQAHVLDQFVALARERQVDAVVIAGDVYDRAVPPAEAVALLNSVLEQLVDDAGIPVIMISGNHDSAERLAFGKKMMSTDGFHVFGPLASATEPLELADEHGPVFFCPLPYAEPSQVRLHLKDEELTSHNAALSALANEMREKVPADARSVAIAHCWVTGGDPSDSERPITVGGAGDVGSECFAGFNYTALGHLHQPQTSGETIHYSGSLLKYSFSEVTHKKSVNLVEMDAAGNVNVERVPLSPRRDVRTISGSMEELLAGPPKGESPDDYLKVSLTDPTAILDAVGKLREVYPNILHLERPGLMSPGASKKRGKDHRNRSEFDLFKDFHAEITSEPMIEGAEDAFNEIVNALRLKEQEVTK
jgi:exonuclease SbcD